MQGWDAGRRIAAGVVAWSVLFAGTESRLLTAQEPTPPQPPAAAGVPPSAFQIPRLMRSSGRLFEQAAAAARQQEWKRAEELARQAVAEVPFLPTPHYQLACLLALEGQTEEALNSLTRALELGFADAARMERDSDLQSLRENDKFRRLVQQAQATSSKLIASPTVAPRAVENGVAWVGPANTAWDPQLNVLRTLFIPPAAAADVVPVKNHGTVGDQLRRWYQEGTAAGNVGDFYDNCDRDHSNLKYSAFPQLARIEYEQEILTEVPFGLQLLLFHGGIVLGNSSTAHVGSPFWRSNPRTAYVSGPAVNLLYAQYRANQLYVYPEHRDHDPGHNGEGDGYGDVFPANTPYLITSQGSSGSDQVFLDALACTLAAFQPLTKKRLSEHGLLMPVLQSIFRRSNKQVEKPEDYLTGVAHPTAFDGKQLNVERMVELAHSLAPDALPPWAELTVVEEEQFEPGRDFFDIGARERLFDTPCAIARVYRSLAARRRIVVSAEGSRDLDGRPLTYHWVVLRGDAEAIGIKRLNEAGSRVEITVPYTPRQPIRAGHALASNRIEIGLFVHNGLHPSPPAFLSWLTLDNEQRTYDRDGRIQQVVYRGATEPGLYADPVIDLPKSWTDDYHYDEAGRLLGWTRSRGTQREEFTADGAVVITRDEQGRPAEARSVRYVARPREERQPPILVQEWGPLRLRYRYADATDRRGEVASREPWEPAEGQ